MDDVYYASLNGFKVMVYRDSESTDWSLLRFVVDVPCYWGVRDIPTLEVAMEEGVQFLRNQEGVVDFEILGRRLEECKLMPNIPKTVPSFKVDFHKSKAIASKLRLKRAKKSTVRGISVGS